MIRSLIFNQDKLLKKINESKIKTPAYLYDKQLFNLTLEQAQKALNNNFARAHIHYAVKANHNSELLTLIKQYPMGVDCVSGGEIQRVLDEGFNASQIVFAGVGKADWEIELALKHDIFAFNCESVEEIRVINQLAEKMQKKAKICLRVNPNIDAKTHKYISTGGFNDKFGMSFDTITEWFTNQYPALKAIEFIGLHYHVGSQIRDMSVFKSLAQTVERHLDVLHKKNIKLQHINFGGGLGVDYDNPEQEPIVDFDSYFKNFANIKLSNNIEVHFELGRSLVAQCGILITQVLFNKTTEKTNFVIVDAGMTELIRPALYQAKHEIKALVDSREQQTYTVVGPICESSDIFAEGITLPKVKRGDILVIHTVGAYGKVLSSEYNLRPRVKEYLT